MNLFAGINWLAVVSAALIALVLRAIWYSPFAFGRARAHALTEADATGVRVTVGARAHAGALVAYVVMAIVLSILIDTTGTMTVVEGLHLGFLCWLGFAATVSLTINLYSGESPAGFYIDATLQLCYMLAMAALLTVWQ